MKILFITRKFPPAVGGMQQYSADFYTTFKDQCNIIALSGAQVHLIWWLPYAFIKGVWLGFNADVIQLGDGVLAWLGVVLHWITRKPISITVHGLDLTYKKFGYQHLIWPALRYYQAIICVSNYTRTIVLEHGLAAALVHRIPNGIPLEDWAGKRTKMFWKELLPNVDLSNKTVLLTIGRLVKRKGVGWFINQVLPKLPESVYYVVASTGPEYSWLKQLIEKHQLQQRVALLGGVNRTRIKRLYLAADLFIMPNIRVPNDMEGFGIVALEAGATGLPVIAAKLEGLEDAVIDGVTGFLVESGNSIAWIKTIESLHTLKLELVKQHVQERFSWSVLKQQYLRVFNQITNH